MSVGRCSTTVHLEKTLGEKSAKDPVFGFIHDCFFTWRSIKGGLEESNALVAGHLSRLYAHIWNTVANSSQDFSANIVEKFCHWRKNFCI
jgi:hypothetical protein